MVADYYQYCLIKGVVTNKGEGGGATKWEGGGGGGK